MRPITVTPSRSPVTEGVDDEVARRLAVALRCATVSTEDPARTADAEFVRLAEHLEAAFPLVHAELTLTRFGHSRLYRWAGVEPDAVSAILLAHQDVVPVDDAQRWTHPPFDGTVDDEFIWGRGAIDDKSRVLAVLEAIEWALAAGIRPHHTVFLAFGHDEEVFGDGGAVRMARYLRDEGVRAELLLDEGGVITDGVADGVDRPVASIMLGEKGYATVRLSVRETGGHSSMPGKQTAVGRLARAVARVQDHPMPLRLTPVISDMLARMRVALPEPRRRLLELTDSRALSALAGPLLTRIMAAGPTTEALVRTTTAPTVISGGVKANVLPQSAEALVNFRILPGDSVAGVLAHCVRVIGDRGVRVELVGPTSEPSRIDAPGPAYALIADIATEVVPGIVTTTGIVPGATDSRHYDGLAATRCNFAPIVLTSADLERIHGTDERISRLNYARLIEFNRRLIERLAATPESRRIASMTTDTGEFAGHGGTIAWRAWQPETTPRAVIVLVHGVAEHSGRYEHVGDALAEQGYAVYALDHVGHGRSEGAAANIGSMQAAADNTATLLELAGAAHPGVPRFLLGHSMGSLVVLHLATRAPVDVAGIVVSAPPLDIPLGNPLQRLAAPLLTRVAPNLGVLTLDSSAISRDPEVVRAYDADPLVFRGKLPARTAVEILEHTALVKQRLGRLTAPVLVLHGTADIIAAPSSSDLIERDAGSTDVTVLRYSGLYHEVFNEPERAKVIGDVTDWLSTHVTGQ
ncbi:M20/M25/M40 family metallo-hydrolase [Nocardia lasii]|uniref:M20/M25/M40 family metallo-hydrolase n=1 Tax=Nocardia lasii TaxID=1616107 RepID=A0ABW1JWA4_9NOCA